MRPVVSRLFSSHSTIPLAVALGAFFASANAASAQTGSPSPAGAPTGAAPEVPKGPAAGTIPKPAGVSSSGMNMLNGVEGMGEYPLAPGDAIGLNVANHPELSGVLPISEAGRIAIPTLGNLTVAGKSIAQAERAIGIIIGRELVKPEITVTLAGAAPRQVLLVGALRSGGGAVNLRRFWRVSDVIDVAGGLTAEPDDLVVTLARGKAKPQTLNLALIQASPTSPANVQLRPGDVLRFNLVAGRVVTVGGDVKAPGIMTLRRNSNLLDAILAAGGLVQKPETSKITLVRAGREIPINAVNAFNDRASMDNAPLFNGDTVTVQAIRTDISIIALHDEVRNAGKVSIEGNPHVVQAVLAANLTTTPDKVNISIRRGAENIPVDLQKAAYDPAFDVPLQEGDVLLVGPLDGPEVRVSGGVQKPGVFNLNRDATLMDAIFQSGGLVAKPEETKLTILRKIDGKQTVLNVDPVGLISLRDLGQNVRLAQGDLVMVNPIQTRTVFIAGQVTSPGAFQMGEDEGLVQLLLRAGGPTPFAQLKQVEVLRQNNTKLTVDLSQSTEPGASRVPIDLEPGDLVTIPKNPKQVLVMNAVARPGYVPFPENKPLTIGDAVLMAGGTTNNARLNAVGLVRRGPNNEITRQVIAIDDVNKPRPKGQPAQLGIDTALQPGDIVYVPEAKVSKQRLQGILGSATSLAVLGNYFK